ncbi:MAG TPA: glycoside hydrolase family 16 protein, partial [Draconibacterium sp.]|nr:glycoside hydrolase family 16 protein [Draconibacterium sp.]
MNRLIQIIIMMLITLTVSAQKYVLVWGDEFNTPGLPDSTKWSYETGKIANNELQYYTSKRLENARIEDSVLIIEARKEKYSGADYTSARIVSRGIGDWKFGKVEISAKVPTGKGTWPALWMMPTYSEYGGWPRSGEMDIMEYIGVEPQNLFYTVHFEGTNGSGHQSNGSGGVKRIANPFNQFIKYTMIWTPDKIEWYANDVKYHTYSKSSDDYRVWPFNKEFYLILNL